MTTTAETTSPAAATTTPVYRVYIGNLTANVQEEQLKNSFSKFGDVSNIKIVKKPKQTFGFVDMANEESAKTAIEKLNKTEIDSQQVDVELAKTERPKRGRPTKQRRPRAPKATTTATTPAATTTTDAPAADASAAPATNGKPKRKSNKPRKSKKTTTTTTGPKATSTTASSDAAAKKQQSTTTLYVRNIPFSFDDAQLLDTFKEYSPKSAHVIINKITKKSRGYGFVEFDDVSNREKALEMDKKVIAEREILVKIALVAENYDTKEATTPDTKTETPTTTTA